MTEENRIDCVSYNYAFVCVCVLGVVPDLSEKGRGCLSFFEGKIINEFQRDIKKKWGP